MRMSQVSDTATPPPTQKPRMRAIVGLEHLLSRALAISPILS